MARPSRTHSLAREGLALLAFLAVGILVIAFAHPEQLDVFARAYGELALYTSALCGVGVGGMAARDAWTGGKTSSAGPDILAAERGAGAATNGSTP